MTSLDRDGDVWILRLGEGDNRFNPTTVGEMDEALDEVAASPAPAALVTSASGKIWSNGLDLDHMAQGGSDPAAFVRTVEALFARLLRLPVPTIAAVGGHAFAAGAMFALAHDGRVMRTDRGYLCLPEIDLGLPFTPGMAALIAGTLPAPARHRMAVLGERVSGPDALAWGVVDAVAAEDRVLADSVERAHRLADKAGPTLVTLRATFHADALRALDPSDKGLSPG